MKIYIKTAATTIYFIFLIFPYGLFSQSCETEFNLNTFHQYGATQGQWNIISSTEATQTGQSVPPTFLVTPMDINNVRITGKMSAFTDKDDDFMGIVFDYHQPTTIAEDNTFKFYLFDWKGGFDDNDERKGFRLAHYNGYIDRGTQMAYFYYDNQNPPTRDIIDTKYGPTLGWEPNVEYTIELIYTSHYFSISIDSVLIFEQTGCFGEGKFGFCTSSQPDIRFRDFVYEEYVEFYPSESSVCTNEDITFYPYDPACTSLAPFVSSLTWFFGDGTTGSEIIPSHSYSSSGSYDVLLVVDKGNNCIDSVIQTINVKPDPVVELGNDTLIPACSVITLDAGNPGASYIWSNGYKNQILEVVNLNKDSTIWVEADKNGCIGSDTILISVEEIASNIFLPNAFTPNGDGRNDTFGPVGNISDLENYTLNIFNRWGQKIYECSLPDIEWDGTCHGEFVPADTYIYYINYQLSNCYLSKADQIKGIVTLIR